MDKTGRRQFTLGTCRPFSPAEDQRDSKTGNVRTLEHHAPPGPHQHTGDSPGRGRAISFQEPTEQAPRWAAAWTMTYTQRISRNWSSAVCVLWAWLEERTHRKISGKQSSGDRFLRGFRETAGTSTTLFRVTWGSKRESQRNKKNKNKNTELDESENTSYQHVGGGSRAGGKTTAPKVCSKKE